MTIMTLEAPSVNFAPIDLDSEAYRPIADESYAPSDLDDAEWLGMSLRLSGEPMGELFGTNSTGLLLRFAVGQYLGLEIRQAEEAADREAIMSVGARHEAYLAEMEERYAGSYWHESERIETVGCLVARLA